MNLALIGYRGSGKTTVARLLAERLTWNWIDTDVEVERRSGKSIAALFAEDGEPAFRDLETKVVAELVDSERTILALGGGAVLREATRAVLARTCKTAWLRATPQTLHERCCQDAATGSRRPGLTALGGLAEIEQVLAEREPIYRACADAIIETDGLEAQKVAEQVQRAFADLLAAEDA